MARILVITNMYPPHHYGGYELANRDVVESLRRRGHDVRVLTTTHRRPGAGDADDGDRVRRDLAFYWDDFVLTRPPFRERLAMERSNQRALGEELATWRPDVVSAWNMGAMSVGLLTTVRREGIPLVLVVADTWLGWAPDYDRWLRPLWRRPGARLLGRAAERAFGVPSVLPDLHDAVPLFASRWLSDRARDESPWAFDRTAIVPWGIDERDFPIGLRPEPAWAWRLLFVGRIDERKGIDVVVRALAELPDAHLRILGPEGDADHQRRLDRLVAELGVGDRIVHAAVARGELASEHRAADVLLFPSVWAEPFGLVGLEGMACGLPVIGTGTGGSGEYLVHEDNALLVPPGDHVALAAAVRRLATDRDLRARLARRGVATAGALTVEHMVDDLEAWHLAAADGFATGAPRARAVLPDGP
jgi:glycosyltransferase involved in cell wall biosynthesis